MSANIPATVVDGAPGNYLTIVGTGLIPGTSAGVVLGNQGVTSLPNVVQTSVGLPATFYGTSVGIGPLPDGITPGFMTITAGDGTTDTVALRPCSQYVQAAEYIGEGVDTSALAPGELDVILREASARADGLMCGSVRLLQTIEKHKYRPLRNAPPKIFPWRCRGRRVPLQSVQQLCFVSAADIRTVFQTTDMYVASDPWDPQLNYIEILAYAIGNYALLGAIEIIGYSANVMELAVTTGYPMASYPLEVMYATKIIATEILTYRAIQQKGLGGLSRLKQGTQQYDRRNEPFAIPGEARELLRPFIPRVVA
jgi:hypothetical protein